MPDLLTFDERSGAGPTVSRYEGLSTPTVLSATFGTENSAAPVQTQYRNRVFRFSSTEIYVVAHDGLYRSTDSGATFALLNAFLDPGAAPGAERATVSGIYLAFGNSTTYLCGVYKSNADVLRGWRRDLNTTTYLETLGPTVGVADDLISSEELFNNVLHFSISDAPVEEYSWNPVAQTFVTFVLPVALAHVRAADYVVAPDGRLKKLAGNGVVDWRLLDLSGVAWVDAIGAGLDANIATIDTATWRPAAFSDGADVFVIFGYDSGGTRGHRVRRIPTPYNTIGSDITAAVLAGHAALLHTDDGGAANANADKRVLVIQDTETTPGTVITYLAFADDDTPATQWTFYKWNGPASAITLIGTGGAVGDSLPTSISGGARFFVPNQLSARMINRSADLLGEKLTWRASGGGNRTVRFRFSRKGQPTTALATLVGPVTGGGALGANEVTNHPADDVTLGTVIWDIVADGVPSSDPNVVLVPEISVS